jgi:hypothetical protein
MAYYDPVITSDGRKQWKDRSGVDTTLRSLCITSDGKKKLKLASGYADPTVDSSGRFCYKGPVTCANWTSCNYIIHVNLTGESGGSIHAFQYYQTVGNERIFVPVDSCNAYVHSCGTPVVANATYYVDPNSYFKINTSTSQISYFVRMFYGWNYVPSYVQLVKSFSGGVSCVQHSATICSIPFDYYFSIYIGYASTQASTLNCSWNPSPTGAQYDRIYFK